ncbi:MAG: RNA polymerase sigma factor [Anaerolineae bacterium]
MSAEEERELISRAKADPEAFGELYERYVSQIYNYHYRHTSSQVEAEDLTSRTFYRALRSLQGYRETGAPFQAWLFRIAHNLLVNWYRDHDKPETVSIDAEDWLTLASRATSPEAWMATRELQGALLEVIDALPEDRKTLLILKFVEQMTNAEIGQVLGRTEGAIKALYHRTLISLRQAMQGGVANVQKG